MSLPSLDYAQQEPVAERQDEVAALDWDAAHSAAPMAASSELAVDLSALNPAATMVNSAEKNRISQIKRMLAASLPWLIVGGGVLLGLGLVVVFLPYQISAKPMMASASLPSESAPSASAPSEAVSSESVSSQAISSAAVVTMAAWPLNTQLAGYINAEPSNKALGINTQLIQSPAAAVIGLTRSAPQAQFNASVQPVLPIGSPRSVMQIERMPVNTTDPLQQAWQAYQGGEFTQAEQYYQQAMQQNPRQRDAALGLAAIAQIRGDVARAHSLYRHILQQHPADTAAKQALLALPQAVTEQDVLQLEQSGQADPQILAQFYASEQRWSQAQAQFFIVYSQNPSATAAFNLAVSLDHLQQPTLALQYYRQALQGVGAFDRSAVQQRIAALSAQPVSSEAQYVAQH
ncbi:tetratricopeptide repeat protein [uncultured Deefgea sp.]|uniref:tetratricopeptide repeat protein n=1 Tax=uncultured Deefgea sp. TaxID=1304914 RepID=UPI002622180E|nr:tetratricopeptide repeat protein [uncultured Deefgea sp.]